MHDARYLRKMINGVPVVTAPAELAITPVDGALSRVICLTCADHVIPRFPSLAGALAPAPPARPGTASSGR